MHKPLSSIRQRLKGATSTAHAALEARIGPLTHHLAYNTYVVGMNAFRCGVETWLARYAPQRADAWQPQTIASALQHDLDDLALTPIDGPVLRWETQLDPSFTMGVHYVLEGSSLGARVLCAQVASFGLHRNYGARHLWVQAEHPNGFRAFIDLLSDRTPALDEDRVIAGANAAFTAAAAAMECASHA